MLTSEKIFRLDNNGSTRFWFYQVDGDKWRGVSGVVGGAEVESGWTTCVPKSQATAEEQAIFEAKAEEAKKLDRKYKREGEDLTDIFTQPMLAQDYDKLKKPLSFPVLAQPKLDGFRAIFSAEGAFTRQGQKYHSVDHILEALAPIFAEYPDLELDGELYNHEFREDFNTLSSLIRSGFKLDKKALKAGVTEEQQRADLAERQKVIQYHVYDMVDTAMKLEDRVDFLCDLFSTFDPDFIEPVDTMEVENQGDLDDLLLDWLSQDYEGQMVRIIGSTYEHTRSKNLLKRKDFETKEFKIKRIEEGNGNWSGKAKRVVIELEDGRENESGIRGSMPYLAKVLAEKEHYEKGWATVRFMKQRTPDGKLRAPVTIDLHPDGRKD